MNRTILSLDFYGKGISAAVALFDTEQGSVRITKLARFDCPHFQDGQVLDLGPAQDELTYVLEELAPFIGLNPKILIGVRGPMLSFQRRTGFRIANARNCIIRDQDIKEALNDAVPSVLPAGTQVLDVWAQSFVVEGIEGIQNPKGRPGVSLEAQTLISYADTSYLADLKNILHLCNVSNYRLLPTAVPIVQQLPSPSEKKGRTLLIDIGNNSTSALLYNKGLVMEGINLAFGDNVLIKQFAKLLEQDVSEAQKILDNYTPDEYVDDAIEDATEFMIQRIYRELSKSLVSFAQKAPTQIILTGNGVSDFTEPIVRDIFQVNKVRWSFLEPETDDDNEDPSVDLLLFTGALSIIYHALQTEDAADPAEMAPVQDGILGKLLGKIGLN